MAHQFVVNATINGVSLDDFRRLAANISLHENVCRRIPGEKLEILESNKVGDIYTLKRAYNLDVNIPDIAKKFLKDAFRDYSAWLFIRQKPNVYIPIGKTPYGHELLCPRNF